MAVREPINIVLGDKSFFIRPTTLGQALRIAEELAEPQGPIELATKIVAIGIGRDKPEEAAKIGDAEATVAELTEAMGAILKFAGFPHAAPIEA